MVDFVAGVFVVAYLSFVLAPKMYIFFREEVYEVEYLEGWMKGNFYMLLALGFAAAIYHLAT